MKTSSVRPLLSALLALMGMACSAPEPQRPGETPHAAAPEARPAPQVPQPAPRSAPAAVPSPSKAQQQLVQGIQSYDDGERKLAAKQIQAALDLGLEAKRDQAKAHKYLAFIVCVTGREKVCREQFRKALDADPAFDLEPAEAGNPVWSAALRSVKAERAKSKTKQTKERTP
jgi:Tfp pilus assembly protein PilF